MPRAGFSKKGRLVALVAAGVSFSALYFVRNPAPDSRPSPGLPAPAPEGPPQPLSGRAPTGSPPTLSCVAARAIVAQVDARLVEAPPPLATFDDAAFATAVVDWLDPHGLWSAAPASAAGEAIRASGRALAAALRDRKGRCEVAHDIGRVLERSVDDLRKTFETARHRGGVSSPNRAFENVFEPGDVKRPASVLADLLGEGCGAIERTGMMGAEQLIDAARERYFPPLSSENWADVVLAAAVRAYVPIVDPHGGWAPFEEEASLYEAELEARPPAPFWEAISRTALGVRIDAGPLAPLAVGDLVLTLEGLPLGGMPLEQIEQLAYAVADERSRATMLVLSEGAAQPRVVVVELPSSEAIAATREGISAEHIRYGERDAVVIAVRDVREDLGDELAREIDRIRSSPTPVAGIVLDLRGNGGGSTDGAAAALGHFLPGAPLFPMRRRDGTLEIDRATEPSREARWEGHVSALVDRSTASAAEMIAGALATYQRGVVVGERTFGKGCAQEYVEDEADVGVLRLTTLVFALPDGSPLQKTGLLPSVLVPFDGPPGESESVIAGSPASFRGPDVRDMRRVAQFAARPSWPALGKGEVGPCRDEDVCRGLRALATVATRRAAKR